MGCEHLRFHGEGEESLRPGETLLDFLFGYAVIFQVHEAYIAESFVNLVGDSFLLFRFTVQESAKIYDGDGRVLI